MQHIYIDPAIGYLLAVALALIFGASGLLKLRDPALFAAALANYALLPRWSERAFAWTLPIAEIGAAAAVLFPMTRAIAAAALALLLVVFSAAIAINLARGRTDIDCGCFGPALRQELSGWLVARNLILMIVAAALAMPEGARQINSLDVVTIVMGASTFVVLYASANYALGNSAATRELELL